MYVRHAIGKSDAYQCFTDLVMGQGRLPIPGEPQLYSEGDMFHLARVTFTVKLVDDTTAEPGV